MNNDDDGRSQSDVGGQKNIWIVLSSKCSNFSDENPLDARKTFKEEDTTKDSPTV